MLTSAISRSGGTPGRGSASRGFEKKAGITVIRALFIFGSMVAPYCSQVSAPFSPLTLR